MSRHTRCEIAGVAAREHYGHNPPVDDDSASLWLLQLTLEVRGHCVVLGNDGQCALEKAAHCIPDLVVTDWNMPRMDGIALCERLKLYPALALIPVILASGDSPPNGKPFLWTRFPRKPVDLESWQRPSIRSSRSVCLGRHASRIAVRHRDAGGPVDH